MITLVTALAGLDKHDSLVEALTVRAGEGHRRGAGAAWGAAAAVPTHAAVVRPIETSTAATCVVET